MWKCVYSIPFLLTASLPLTVPRNAALHPRRNEKYILKMAVQEGTHIPSHRLSSAQMDVWNSSFSIKDTIRHTNTQYQRLKWPKAAGNQHILVALYILTDVSNA